MVGKRKSKNRVDAAIPPKQLRIDDMNFSNRRNDDSGDMDDPDVSGVTTDQDGSGGNDRDDDDDDDVVCMICKYAKF